MAKITNADIIKPTPAIAAKAPVNAGPINGPSAASGPPNNVKPARSALKSVRPTINCVKCAVSISGTKLAATNNADVANMTPPTTANPGINDAMDAMFCKPGNIAKAVNPAMSPANNPTVTPKAFRLSQFPSIKGKTGSIILNNTAAPNTNVPTAIKPGANTFAIPIIPLKFPDNRDSALTRIPEPTDIAPIAITAKLKDMDASRRAS